MAKSKNELLSDALMMVVVWEEAAKAHPNQTVTMSANMIRYVRLKLEELENAL